MTFEEEELLVADSLGGDSARMVSNNPKDRDYYLKDIPFTEEQITASNDKMIDAYFMLGRLYKEGLNNYPKSGESFETLIDRFPENKYQLPSYYDLYKIFESLDSIQKAEYYKNLVLSGFPESDYAKVIENPDYFKELSEQQNEAGKLYEKTYKAYQEGQYFLVINYCDLALVEFAYSEIIPKFLYLKALSIGKVEV